MFSFYKKTCLYLSSNAISTNNFTTLCFPWILVGNTFELGIVFPKLSKESYIYSTFKDSEIQKRLRNFTLQYIGSVGYFVFKFGRLEWFEFLSKFYEDGDIFHLDYNFSNAIHCKSYSFIIKLFAEWLEKLV